MIVRCLELSTFAEPLYSSSCSCPGAIGIPSEHVGELLGFTLSALRTIEGIPIIGGPVIRQTIVSFFGVQEMAPDMVVAAL